MRIEKFEEPKKITIKELVELLDKQKHPICTFEYGDFDNYVSVAITSISIDLRFTHFCPNSIYGPKWCACLRKDWKYLYELEKVSEWFQAKREDTGYGDDHYVENLADVYDKEIEIVGIVHEH